MRPSSRHLYPQWLRLGTARDDAAGSGARSAGTADGPQLDGAWRLWERVRDFDRRYAALVDVASTAALFFLCSGVFFSSLAGPPNLVVVAALIFPLVFRRRAPMTVFLVIAAVAFVQWLVSGPALADASLLVAVYTVALESEWVLVAVASVILEAGIVMAAVRWTPGSTDVAKSFVFMTGLAVAAILAGIVVRALRSQLAWLAERAERLELERDQQASLATAAERARIAREMHDVVSHNIQVMVTLADAAAAQAADPARAAEAMQEVSSTGRQALTDMRRLLGVLRDERPAAPSGAADGAGATPPERPSLAPQPGLGELDALVERVRGTGLAVSIECAGRPFDVTGAAGLTVYRIVQEALTNALKHADDPVSVQVALEFRDPDITVCVHDDGGTKVVVGGLGATALGAGNGSDGTNGHDPGRHGNGSGGHGLAGMAERAAAFGGTLRAGPAPAGGWEVTATLRDCRAPAAR